MFGCCCNCNDGAIIDRWLNGTQVRKTVSCVDFTVNNVDPYPRYIYGLDYVNCTASSTKTKVPADWMGPWQVADANGYPTQSIDPIVDDILACAANDATHKKLDHNCYTKNSTVDLRTERRGGRWVLGKKWWHGILGMTSVDVCGTDAAAAAVAPDQNKYLSTLWDVAISANSSDAVYSGGIDDYAYTASGGIDVNRLTGLRNDNRTVSGYQNRYLSNLRADLLDTKTVTNKGAGTVYNVAEDKTYNYAGGLSTTLDSLLGNHFACDSLPPVPDSFFGSGVALNGIVDWWNTTYASEPNFVAMAAVTSFTSYSDTKTFEVDTGGVWPGTMAYISLGWAKTNTSMYWSMTVRVPVFYALTGPVYLEFSYVGTYSLTNAYSASQCLADLYQSLADCNLSNSNAMTWRRDELLGLARLCTHDEVQSVVTPVRGYTPSVNNYVVGLIADPSGKSYGDSGYIETWAQRDWFDPNGFIWQTAAGHRFTEAEAGGLSIGDKTGCSLLGPMYSGGHITNGVAGSERLFWFGYGVKERRFSDPLTGGNGWEWVDTGFGSYVPSTLCNSIGGKYISSVRRWMNPDEAQWDGAAFRGVGTAPPSGNYPQSFLRQQHGALVGGKYVEATQNWPAVDFNYPCGDARFDVDQTTVCCIVSGDAGSGFTVKKTGNAASVPAVSDKILVEGSGIYPVTAVTSLGGSPAQWTITVGSKIEDVPAGRSCLPSILEATDIHRDGSTHLGKLRWWTTTPTACVTPNPVSNKTGVRLEWSFNTRQARLATGSQPNWLGGSGAGTGTGVVGCTGLTLAEFNYTTGRCPAVVGYVPFYSASPVESFPNQSLFAMPNTFTFDDRFGALWLGGVEMVMPDPFWQDPFKPDCDLSVDTSLYLNWSALTYFSVGDTILDANGNLQVVSVAGYTGSTEPTWGTSGDTGDGGVTWTYAGAPAVTTFLLWNEDNGTGQPDTVETRGSSTIYTKYFPHRRWVAARCTIPTGMTLPSGISLFYATGSAISPADGTNIHYDSVSGGVVIADTAGNYRSIERPWGFTDRACSVGNRFGDFYQTFTQCP